MENVDEINKECPLPIEQQQQIIEENTNVPNLNVETVEEIATSTQEVPASIVEVNEVEDADEKSVSSIEVDTNALPDVDSSADSNLQRRFSNIQVLETLYNSSTPFVIDQEEISSELAEELAEKIDALSLEHAQQATVNETLSSGEMAEEEEFVMEILAEKEKHRKYTKASIFVENNVIITSGATERKNSTSANSAPADTTAPKVETANTNTTIPKPATDAASILKELLPNKQTDKTDDLLPQSPSTTNNNEEIGLSSKMVDRFYSFGFENVTSKSDLNAFLLIRESPTFYLSLLKPNSVKLAILNTSNKSCLWNFQNNLLQNVETELYLIAKKKSKEEEAAEAAAATSALTYVPSAYSLILAPLESFEASKQQWTIENGALIHLSTNSVMEFVCTKVATPDKAAEFTVTLNTLDEPYEKGKQNLQEFSQWEIASLDQYIHQLMHPQETNSASSITAAALADNRKNSTVIENYFSKREQPVSASSTSIGSSQLMDPNMIKVQDGIVLFREDSFFNLKAHRKYFLLNKSGKLSFFNKAGDKKAFLEIYLQDPDKIVCYFEDKKKGKLCLKMTAGKKSFFIFMDTPLELKNFKKALQSLGAKEDAGIIKERTGFTSQHLFSAGPSSTTSKSRVETIDVAHWTIDDVQEWLGYIHTTDGKMVERYGENFLDHQIDGKTLITLDDDKLKDVGVKSLGMRKRLLAEIAKLQSQRHYSLNEHLVFSKVKNMDAKYLKSIPDMEEMVKSLCDREKIRQVYLSTKKLTSDQLRRWAEEGVTGNDFEIVNSREYREYSEIKLRVKLVITEIAHTDSEKTLRKIFSPVVASIPSFNIEFGFFHTALIVGPWYLEWCDSSLCIPKKICSSMALLSADVDNIIVPKEGLEEIADKLAEVVTEWNIKYTYINFKLTGKKPTEGNCQDFCDAILEKLDLKPIFTGALGNFLSQMRQSGKCRMEFKPDKDFKEMFELKENSYLFNTHEELDRFVIQLKEKCSTLKIDFPSEWSLLKSFDRAFWLRYLKNKKNAKYMPLGGSEDTKCPFMSPLETQSFL